MPDNKFYLYDRIEFNDWLRYADVAEDVAHLAMDLELHGRTDSENALFLSTCFKAKMLFGYIVYFLMCYKACVRAKVSLFRAKGLEKTTNTDDDRKRKQWKGRGQPAISRIIFGAIVEMLVGPKGCVLISVL